MRQKITSLITCILFAMQTSAVQITVNGITYNDYGSSTIHEGLYRNVTVVGVSADVAGAVTIPALPAQFSDGLFYFRVTAIARDVFRDNTKITSITLPNTVTSIGIGAFNNCTALTHFEVDEKNALYSSADGVLLNKNGSVLLLYPPGRTESSFSIPETVVVIPEYAFLGSGLNSISIPPSVTTIGDWAFGECTNLTSITIPRNVVDISTSAFNLCTSLTHFEVAEENTKYSALDGVLYNKNKTSIIRYPPNKANASFSMPSSVTEVGRYAFRDCLKTVSIEVSDNVSGIGSGAFAWSKNTVGNTF